MPGGPYVGMDLLRISRVAGFRTRRGDALRRLFTEAEWVYCLQPSAEEEQLRRMTARIAAKEAISKALGTGLSRDVRWADLEVIREAEGSPQVRLHGEAARHAERLGIRHWTISLSHEGDYAWALCLATGEHNSGLAAIPGQLALRSHMEEDAEAAESRLEAQLNERGRTTMYPLVDGNVGAFIARRGATAAQRILNPTGIRLMARRGETIAYEVIRLRNGIPLFWEDHCLRLERSAAAAGLPVPGRDEIWAVAHQLYQAQPRKSANLRLVLTDTELWAHYSQYYYPSEEQLRDGVPTAMIDWERVDPQVKLIRPDYKAAVATKLGQEGPCGLNFEVLLRNRADQLTEGSRSNLFFLKGDTVYSAPDEEILLGITRKYILEAIADTGLTLSLSLPTWTEVRESGDYTAFLSGSPIDILPICAVDEHRLPSPAGTRLPALMQAYQRVLDRVTAACPELSEEKFR